MGRVVLTDVDHTTEFELLTADGIRLWVRDWHLPVIPVTTATSIAADKQKPRCGIIIMHGLSEHSGRYQHVVDFFHALGYLVRTYDHRGHGRSGGAPGDVPDDEAILRDARLVINDFSKLLSAPPLLFGHSMGGLFAARFATAGLAPLRGLILSSPALAVRLSGWHRFLLKLATRVAPGFAIPNNIGSTYLTHNPAILAAYQQDPLIHARISARLLRSMLSAMIYAHDHAPQLRIPVLLLVAEDDYIVDVLGSRRFLARVPTELLTAEFYAGFYHEIFNEIEAARVFDDLKTWLQVQHLLPDSHPTTLPDQTAGLY